MHAPSADLTLLGMAFGTAARSGSTTSRSWPGSSASAPDRASRPCSSGCWACGSTRASATPTGAGGPCRPHSSSTPPPTSCTSCELADELDRRAEALGREEWVAEEHERRYGPDARIVPGPRDGLAPGQGPRAGSAPATAPCSRRWRPGARSEARRRDKPGLVGGARPHPGRDRPPPPGRPAAPSSASAACPTASGARRPTGCWRRCAPARRPRRSPPRRPRRPSCSSAWTCSARSAPCSSVPGRRPSTWRRACWRPATRSSRVPRGGDPRRRRRPAARLGLAARDRGRRADRAGRRGGSRWRPPTGGPTSPSCPGRAPTAPVESRPVPTRSPARRERPYDHIACFIDDSDAATRALAHAAALRDAAGGKLSVVHVLAPPAFLVSLAARPRRRAGRTTPEVEREAAEMWLAEEARSAGAEAVLLEGHPASTAVRLGARGRRGRHGRRDPPRPRGARRSLGSFAGYVAHHAPCAVLLVPPEQGAS